MGARRPTAASDRTIDASVLLLCCLLLVGAAVLSPSSSEVTFFGYEVPVLCGFRRLTGQSCPGCGLTRSFTFMAHGLVGPAYRTHVLGPVAFLLVALQLPYRGWRLWRPMPAAEVTTSEGRGHAADQ